MKKTPTENYKKIAVLGGTFDPPHKGHLHIAKIAIKKFKLKKLMWVITKKNSLKKKPYLNTKVRVKLSRKLVKNEKKIVVKYLDDKLKSTKTFTLLRYILKKNKNAKIYFLMGADNFIKFHKWYSWQKIAKIANIVVFARKNYFTKAFNSIASRRLKKSEWLYINSKKINISSSLIRKFW